jgi:hypothetical protein
MERCKGKEEKRVRRGREIIKGKCGKYELQMSGRSNQLIFGATRALHDHSDTIVC